LPIPPLPLLPPLPIPPFHMLLPLPLLPTNMHTMHIRPFPLLPLFNKPKFPFLPPLPIPLSLLLPPMPKFPMDMYTLPTIYNIPTTLDTLPTKMHLDTPNTCQEQMP
jgi:hypothetical protein